jgi:hypothetical protein
VGDDAFGVGPGVVEVAVRNQRAAEEEVDLVKAGVGVVEFVHQNRGADGDGQAGFLITSRARFSGSDCPASQPPPGAHQRPRCAPG